MSSTVPPFEIPQRLSLCVQAATSIRKAIDEGAWTEFLPSERRLCEMFQVSRPTIRTALHSLAKDGLLSIQQGRRNRLLAQPAARAPERGRLIGLVTHEPFSHMSLTTYQGISEMRAHLAEHGFVSEVLVCPPRGIAAQHRKLEAFVRQNRVLCCVLLSVSKELQQWFSAHAVPALVLGSCHPDVKLPSLDVDYRSVCRHAAGIFLSKGHRHLALVVPNSGVAGDLTSEQGFLEGANTSANGVTATIIRHNGTAQSITAKLDAALNSSHPPTALLVAKPQHVFIVIIYLLKRGVSVPDAVSLIARDHDHLFEQVSPQISHYSFANNPFVHRLSRLMLQMVRQGIVPLEASLLFPEYFPGGTVRRIP